MGLWLSPSALVLLMAPPVRRSTRRRLPMSPLRIYGLLDWSGLLLEEGLIASVLLLLLGGIHFGALLQPLCGDSYSNVSTSEVKANVANLE